MTFIGSKCYSYFFHDSKNLIVDLPHGRWINTKDVRGNTVVLNQILVGQKWRTKRQTGFCPESRKEPYPVLQKIEFDPF